MLEQSFLDEAQASPDESQAKRRKVSATSTPQATDIDDDDEGFPFHTMGFAGTVPRGKKAKMGTGYAGNQREDVSS